MPRIVIIGAGISGLALAYRLQQRLPQAETLVLERAQRVGGTVWTEAADGYRVEWGPNGFLDNKPSTTDLCRDLGLADKLVPASEASARNRYLYLDGRLRRLPNSLASFLRTDLLSWRGKAAFLLERYKPRRAEATDETIDQLARRRLGSEAALFADAFVTGIHAGDPKLLSARSALPRLTQFEAEHGSIARGMAAAARQRRSEGRKGGQRMWSFAGGMQVLTDTLAQRVRLHPITGVNISTISRAEGGRWLVQGSGFEPREADAVALTCPAAAQAAMLKPLDAALAEQVGGIAYNAVAVVALGFRREAIPGSLDGFGFIAPQSTRRDLLGAQYCSSIFAERAPPGFVLLRVMCGGWHRGEQVDWPDEQLRQCVVAELKQALGVREDPCFCRITRWRRAIPQYHVGHSARLAWLAERLKMHGGLFLGGNAFRGVALNDCTEQASILAEAVAAYLSVHRP